MIATQPTTGVQAAYESLLRYLGEGDDTDLHDVLFHPVSLDKLRAASATVLRRCPQHLDWHAELMQEAALDVLHRFPRRRLRFRGSSVDAFQGWLWKLWHNACRSAWRRLRNDSRRQPQTNDRLDEQPASAAGRYEQRADRWPEVLRAIIEIEDTAIREVLIDWASGLNGAESAQRRGVTKGTISKRRQNGVAKLREQFNIG